MSRMAAAYTAALMKGRRKLARWIPLEAASPFPAGSRALAGILRHLRRHIIPAGSAWIRVQNGFAKGVWLRIDLARERTWASGEHEPGVQELLKRIVQDGTVLYDVGAHIGFFSLPAARTGALVFSFEPDPENAARLRDHIARNSLTERVRSFEVALWSESIPALAFRRGLPRSQGGISCGDHQPVIATGESIEVKTITLDDFVLSGMPAPDVIKVDVEGAASEVLQGARRTIERCLPSLIIEIHTIHECNSVQEFLNEYPYTLTWDIPPEGFPRQCFASASNSSEVRR